MGAEGDNLPTVRILRLPECDLSGVRVRLSRLPELWARRQATGRRSMSYPLSEEFIAALYAGIGDRVRHYREQQGLTQGELAAALDLTRVSITNLEAGRQRMKLHNIYALAECLGVGIGDLLGTEIQWLTLGAGAKGGGG